MFGYLYLLKVFRLNDGRQVYKCGLTTQDNPFDRFKEYRHNYCMNNDDIILIVNINKNLDVFEKIIFDKLDEDNNIKIQKGREYFVIEDNDENYIMKIEDLIIKEREEFRKNNFNRGRFNNITESSFLKYAYEFHGKDNKPSSS
jgi:hypothetical protein